MKFPLQLIDPVKGTRPRVRERERENERREREYRSIAQSQGEQLQGSNLLAEKEAPKADFCSSMCMQLPMLSGCLTLNKTCVSMHPKPVSHLRM